MKFTPTQWRVIVAAHLADDALSANIDSPSVKTKVIGHLTTLGLLSAKNVEGQIQLTDAGQEAFWHKAH